MADSVDRVFGHALNTVNKIRPGSQKPPSADRLALYGLYKQSMEGDVSLVADRPSLATQPGASAEQLRKEQEKWDAWNANHGISRTEAKRRYISTLIDTMHKYASTTEEARELVEELEFVWDQIKNNSNHSSSEHSSPLQDRERRDYMHNGSPGDVAPPVSSSAAAFENAGGGRGQNLRVLSPVSQQDEAEAQEMEEEREEFVDAPVSQFDPAEIEQTPEQAAEGRDDHRPQPRRMDSATGDVRWRRRVEAALVKMTTEVAALREQLESRRYFSYRRRQSLLGWILRISWFAVKIVVADVCLLWIVILYMRRKKDRRLEGAVRVLLGDAVAQVQKIKVPQLPKIAGRKT